MVAVMSPLFCDNPNLTRNGVYETLCPQPYACPVGLPRLHVLTVAFPVFAINVYKIGLPFTRTLARVQFCGI